MGRWMNKQMHGFTDGWRHGQMDGWLDGQMTEQTVGKMGGWLDKWTDD